MQASIHHEQSSTWLAQSRTVSWLYQPAHLQLPHCALYVPTNAGKLLRRVCSVGPTDKHATPPSWGHTSTEANAANTNCTGTKTFQSYHATQTVGGEMVLNQLSKDKHTNSGTEKEPCAGGCTRTETHIQLKHTIVQC